MPFFKVSSSNGYAGCDNDFVTEAITSEEAYDEEYENRTQDVEVTVNEISKEEYEQNI